MRNSILAIIAAMAMSNIAHADDIRRNFDRIDREMALNAATFAIDFLWNYPNGTKHKVTWNNPNTGNNGEVIHQNETGRNGHKICHHFIMKVTIRGETFSEKHRACLKGFGHPKRKKGFTENRTWIVNDIHKMTVRYTRDYVKTDSCLHGIFNYDVVNDDGPEKGNSASIICQKTRTVWAVQN